MENFNFIASVCSIISFIISIVTLNKVTQISKNNNIGKSIQKANTVGGDLAGGDIKK
jgi:hypothetical protein